MHRGIDGIEIDRTNLWFNDEDMEKYVKIPDEKFLDSVVGFHYPVESHLTIFFSCLVF